MRAKHDTHGDYELERDPTASVEQQAAAREASERRWASVKTPPGIAELVELGGVPVKPKTYANPYKTQPRKDAP